MALYDDRFQICRVVCQRLSKAAALRPSSLEKKRIRLGTVRKQPLRTIVPRVRYREEALRSRVAKDDDRRYRAR